MKPARTLPGLVLLYFVTSGCFVTTTREESWPSGPPSKAPYARYGRVENVRDVVRDVRGDPGAGAAAGAIIGGLLGATLGGPYGRASAAGAIFGATSGAAIGATASEGRVIDRRSEVIVRFDDGAAESFVYAGPAPFRMGEAVVETDQGLYPR